MKDTTSRSVRLERLALGQLRATNPAGATIEMSSEGTSTFSPVELLLAAIAGCTAMDVDYITAKRAEPSRFELDITAEKIRDQGGNRLVDIAVTFHVMFPDDEGGRAATEVLPSAIQRSHDRLCTVSRTVELGAPIEVRLG